MRPILQAGVSTGFNHPDKLCVLLPPSATGTAHPQHDASLFLLRNDRAKVVRCRIGRHRRPGPGLTAIFSPPAIDLPVALAVGLADQGRPGDGVSVGGDDHHGRVITVKFGV